MMAEELGGDAQQVAMHCRRAMMTMTAMMTTMTTVVAMTMMTTMVKIMKMKMAMKMVTQNPTVYRGLVP